MMETATTTGGHMPPAAVMTVASNMDSTARCNRFNDCSVGLGVCNVLGIVLCNLNLFMPVSALQPNGSDVLQITAQMSTVLAMWGFTMSIAWDIANKFNYINAHDYLPVLLPEYAFLPFLIAIALFILGMDLKFFVYLTAIGAPTFTFWILTVGWLGFLALLVYAGLRTWAERRIHRSIYAIQN
jgi:hypothetical protein